MSRTCTMGMQGQHPAVRHIIRFIYAQTPCPGYRGWGNIAP